jgi:hypothetical protein
LERGDFYPVETSTIFQKVIPVGIGRANLQSQVLMSRCRGSLVEANMIKVRESLPLKENKGWL